MSCSFALKHSLVNNNQFRTPSQNKFLLRNDCGTKTSPLHYGDGDNYNGGENPETSGESHQGITKLDEIWALKNFYIERANPKDAK